jgi:hypothetical protein
MLSKIRKTSVTEESSDLDTHPSTRQPTQRPFRRGQEPQPDTSGHASRIARVYPPAPKVQSTYVSPSAGARLSKTSRNITGMCGDSGIFLMVSFFSDHLRPLCPTCLDLGKSHSLINDMSAGSKTARFKTLCIPNLKLSPQTNERLRFHEYQRTQANHPECQSGLHYQKGKGQPHRKWW